ncbi:MAG: SDR family oxidoreductase [Actinomycetia bacterium]|nr:SDR family oxidoreductase [Actinomycetes bacterium]
MNVLVTGASRGIGEALARRFADEGANLIVVARSEPELNKLADELGGAALVADLADTEQVDTLIPRAEAAFGGIDILVNNAGLETTAGLTETSVEAIRSVVRVNLEAPIVLTRAVIGGMHKRGRGHLVYTSSLAGIAGFPGLATYAGTKAGLTNFAASMRLELNQTEIGTTIIAPGPVDTRMWGALENEPYSDALLKRLNTLRLIPKTNPERLAKRTVAAVKSNRRHVRHPARMSANFWLNEAPRRITELATVGVRYRPPIHLPHPHLPDLHRRDKTTDAG